MPNLSPKWNKISVTQTRSPKPKRHLPIRNAISKFITMVFQKYAFMNLEIVFRIGRWRFVLEIAFHFGDRFGTYGPPYTQRLDYYTVHKLLHDALSSDVSMHCLQPAVMVRWCYKCSWQDRNTDEYSTDIYSLKQISSKPKLNSNSNICLFKISGVHLTSLPSTFWCIMLLSIQHCCHNSSDTYSSPQNAQIPFGGWAVCYLRPPSWLQGVSRQ